MVFGIGCEGYSGGEYYTAKVNSTAEVVCASLVRREAPVNSEITTPAEQKKK